MRDESNKVAFDDCKCTAQTSKAILVDIEGVPLWVPQSQIDDDSEVWKIDDEGTLIVSRWWAEKAGLV